MKTLIWYVCSYRSSQTAHVDLAEDGLLSRARLRLPPDRRHAFAVPPSHQEDERAHLPLHSAERSFAGDRGDLLHGVLSVPQGKVDHLRQGELSGDAGNVRLLQRAEGPRLPLPPVQHDRSCGEAAALRPGRGHDRLSKRGVGGVVGVV